MRRFLGSSILVVALLLTVGSVHAFVASPVARTTTTPSSATTSSLAVFRFGGGSARGASSSASKTTSPLAEEALASFPFLFRPEKEAENAPGRPKLCTTKSKALKTFNEMARLYGDDRALQMVKTDPIVLCFNADNFEPSLNAWAEQFSVEAAQNMVARNPGLLGVPPVLAAEPAESTMALSYIVFATRPTLLKCVALTAVLLYVFNPNRL